MADKEKQKTTKKKESEKKDEGKQEFKRRCKNCMQHLEKDNPKCPKCEFEHLPKEKLYLTRIGMSYLNKMNRLNYNPLTFETYHDGVTIPTYITTLHLLLSKSFEAYSQGNLIAYSRNMAETALHILVNQSNLDPTFDDTVNVVVKQLEGFYEKAMERASQQEKALKEKKEKPGEAPKPESPEEIKKKLEEERAKRLEEKIEPQPKKKTTKKAKK